MPAIFLAQRRQHHVLQFGSGGDNAQKCFLPFGRDLNLDGSPVFRIALFCNQFPRGHSLEHFAECIPIAADAFGQNGGCQGPLLIQCDEHPELPWGDVALPGQILIQYVVAGFEQPEKKPDAALQLPIACDIRVQARLHPFVG